METTKIIEINKLGRNVYFDSENHIKYVIMNNPSDAISIPPYPLVTATPNQVLSTCMFYNVTTKQWEWGNVDLYYGGTYYDLDSNHQIIGPTINQLLTKNGSYLCKPLYDKDVMKHKYIDINIPTVEKTVNVEEFGQFQIFDEDGKHISKVNLTNKPNFDFFGVKFRWSDGTSQTFSRNDWVTKSGTGKLRQNFADFLIYKNASGIVFYHNVSHGAPDGPVLNSGDQYLSVPIYDDNNPSTGAFVKEMDFLFDTVYHEYDPVLGWTVKTLKFVVGSWIQSTITGPLYDMVWSYLFPNRANLLTLGANILDAAIEGLDVFFPDE